MWPEDWPATLESTLFIVRAAFVVGSVLLGGLPGPVLYGLAWAVVPEDGKTTSIASERLGAPPWLG